MGLLSKLNNGDTQLKSLKFGYDRPGGNDSGQPYIQKPLNDGAQPNALDNDFLWRGGSLTISNVIDDVSRLTKYFFDTKNPQGALFTTKQNILSRVGTKTEATKGGGYSGGLLNEGVYLPSSTLAEAAVVFNGGHLNKQGIDPTGLISDLAINRYQDVIIQNQFTGRIDLENNRLVRLATAITNNVGVNNFSGVKKYQLNGPGVDTILSYPGGPNSVSGFGNTNIKFATDNANNPVKSILGPQDYQTGKPIDAIEPEKFISPIQASEKYIYLSPNGANDFSNVPNNLTRENNISYTYDFSPSVYQLGSNGEYTLEPIQGVKDYLSTGKSIDKISPSEFQLPTGSSKAFNEAFPDTPTKSNQIPIESNDNNPTYLILGPTSYEYNTSFSVYKTSLTGKPTLESRTDLKTYLTKKDVNRTVTVEGDTTYESQIQPKLVSFGRQLIIDSVYRDGTFYATDPETGFVLDNNFYSSRNTLATDALAVAQPNDDLKHNLHVNGYLANLNKNGGSYIDSATGKTVTYHNPVHFGGIGRGIAPDFIKASRAKRGFNDPIDVQAYDYYTTKGSDYYNGTETLVDRIYYDSSKEAKNGKRTSTAFNNPIDLIDFKIAILDPENPGTETVNLKFRAYIDEFSDSYTAEWNDQSYMGRGEKFYKYNTFGREISLGFTAVADSEANLMAMYDQLNKLASTLAPTYTTKGYLAGNIHVLTVGNYIKSEYGIMKSLTFAIDEDSIWEIKTGKQLPHVIRISGIQFTPIQKFRPESVTSNPNVKYIYQK
jgi:hypothetical protein